MDLQAVVEEMEKGQEKVAAAAEGAEATPAPAEANALAGALEKAAQAVPAEEAGGGDAVEALQAVAEKLAAQEREADLAHANLCGQAFADGAINKFAAWDATVKMAQAQQAQQPSSLEAPIAPVASAPTPTQPVAAPAEQKTAQAEPSEDEVILEKLAYQQQIASLTEEQLQQASQEELQKLAELKEASQLTYGELMKIAAVGETDEEVYKLAAQQGYIDTMEKAAAEYKAGSEQALMEVHHTAVGEFLKGAAEAEMLVNQFRAEAQQRAAQ